MSFSPADREEENTEDCQVEYEDNEESLGMEDDIQALDSQLGKKELDCYMKISSYQELVLKGRAAARE